MRFLLLGSLFCVSSLLASRWTHHADFTELNALVASDGMFVGSSSRGAVLFDPMETDSSLAWSHLSLADGMRSLRLTDVCVDAAGNRFWSGQDLSLSAMSADGIPSRGFLEFSQHSQISRINELSAEGNQAFVSHSLGVTAFSYTADRDEFIVGWTLYGIADFPYQSEALCAAGYGTQFLVVTADGVALGQGLPEIPENWWLLPEPGGIIADAQCDVNDNGFYLSLDLQSGATNVFLIREAGQWELLNSFDTETRVSALCAEANDWAYASETGNSTSVYLNNALTHTMISQVGALLLDNGRLWAARHPDRNPGALLELLPDGQALSHFPNVPGAGEFVDLDIDPGGSLWAAGVAESSSRNGLFRLKEGQWEAWKPGYTFLGSYPTSIACDTDGGVWFGSWGRGLSRLIVEENRYQKFSNDSPQGQQMYGYYNNQDTSPEDIRAAFPLVSDVEQDAQGNMWVVNHQAMNDSCLVVIPAEWFSDTTTSFARAYYSQLGVRFPYSIYRDPQGEVWTAINGKEARDERKRILRLRPFGHSINELSQWDLEDHQLYSEIINFGFESLGYVNDVKGDTHGNIWVATSNGFYQGGVYGGTAQFSRVLFLDGLIEEQISTLDVDGRGRIWLGSSAGANVYDPSLTEFADPSVAREIQDLLREVNGLNVNKLCLDNETGAIWLATNLGLFHCETGAENYGLTHSGRVDIYPNPFRPTGENVARVPGRHLVNGARLSIYALDGHLVKTLGILETEDGWDGRDKHGDLVEPGIYLLLLASDSGSSEGKIAVIR